MNYDSANHLFTLPVVPGGSGTATVALSPVPVPSLQITNSAGQLQVSWPAAAQGFMLEQAATLTTPTIWTPVTNTVNVLHGRNVVTVTSTDLSRFYRLRQ